MFGKRRTWVRCCTVLAALVAIDLVLARTWLAEGRIGKRPLPPFGALSSDGQRAALARLELDQPASDALTGFDRELGWCVRPNASRADGEFQIGPFGARGARDYAPTPPPYVVRLACYGDSFTFGDEVKDEWTYEALLESLDPRVQALNFGVPAYGTDQALLRMRRDGLRGARVAVIGLLLENIGRNVNRYRTLWTPRTETPLAKPRVVLAAHAARTTGATGGGSDLELVPQPFATGRELAAAVRDGSILERLAEHEYWRGRPAIPTGEWSALVRVVGGVLAYRERTPERLWLDRDGEPRRVTLAILEAFRDEARARGAERVLVLVLPMKEELAAFRASGRAYWTEVLEELEARGLEYLDVAPALAAEERELERNASTATLYVASHLSSVGNSVVARELHAWLLAQRLVPER
ncbi:MAG: hypothetical protein IT453_15360 [Planctomycetes bacterium]|nr:hypothetical protein [Planctomycetota bacterium]